MDKRIEQELTFKEWEKQRNVLVAFLKKKFEPVHGKLTVTGVIRAALRLAERL